MQSLQDDQLTTTPRRASLFEDGKWRVETPDNCGYVVLPSNAPPWYRGRSPIWFNRHFTESMTHLARLKLQLDTACLGNHTHNDYAGGSYGTDHLPNRATELELVQVCRALGPKLVGLSISMCKPELTVPHIPRFVHEIVSVCPELRSFGLEDVQCVTFGELEDMFGCTVNDVESIAQHDQSQEWRGLVQQSSNLHTLVISKRSITSWRTIPTVVHQYNTTTVYPKHSVTLTGVDDPELAANMCNEARELAVLMMANFPSLRRAHVMLNDDTVDLRMVKCREIDPVFAGDAYLAPLDIPWEWPEDALTSAPWSDNPTTPSRHTPTVDSDMDGSSPGSDSTANSESTVQEENNYFSPTPSCFVSTPQMGISAGF